MAEKKKKKKDDKKTKVFYDLATTGIPVINSIGAIVGNAQLTSHNYIMSLKSARCCAFILNFKNPVCFILIRK